MQKATIAKWKNSKKNIKSATDIENGKPPKENLILDMENLEKVNFSFTTEA